MVDEVGFHRPDFWIIDHCGNAHGIDFDPLAVFPIFAALGDFAQVDLGIEVGRERLAVIACVAVDDVDGVNLVVQLLLRVGAEDIGDAGIKAAAQNRHQALGFELVVIRPLPFVSELGFFLRLVVGGVHIMHARFQAGVHDGQVLVGQRHVDDEVRFDLF